MTKHLLLLAITLVCATACSVSKQQLWKCLVEHGDTNKDHSLSETEVRKLVTANTYWYERLIKSPDSVVQQMQEHCSIPLTYGNILKPSCFKHCGGIDGKRTIYNRICHQ